MIIFFATLILLGSACVAWATPPASPIPPAAPAEPFTPSPDVLEMTDIIDIKPAMSPGLGVDWTQVLAVFGIVLAAALLLFFVYRLFRKDEAPEPEPEPHVEALSALQGLPGLKLDSRLFYFSLSEIARRYVERRFAVPALEMTSEEFSGELSELPLPVELRDRMFRLVRRWDICKYAGVPMDEDRRERDRILVRELVAMTVPVSGEEEDEHMEDSQGGQP